MNNKSPKIDEYMERASKWKEVQTELRSVLLEHPLDEDRKWGKPCYAYKGTNLAILQPFKEFCALMFFKGALMPDPADILETQGENSQAARRIRFTSVEDVHRLELVLHGYINEAIEVEKAGLTVNFKAKTELVLAEELQARLDSDPALKNAFEALTPGRQRSYNLHISAAKQSATRASRTEKCVDKILSGKGFNER